MFNKRSSFSAPYKWYYGWNLFWWKIEGIGCLNGLNVYLPSDPHSAGFVIKVGILAFRVRWSKRVKQWFIGFKRFYK